MQKTRIFCRRSPAACQAKLRTVPVSPIAPGVPGPCGSLAWTDFFLKSPIGRENHGKKHGKSWKLMEKHS